MSWVFGGVEFRIVVVVTLGGDKKLSTAIGAEKSELPAGEPLSTTLISHPGNNSRPTSGRRSSSPLIHSPTSTLSTLPPSLPLQTPISQPPRGPILMSNPLFPPRPQPPSSNKTHLHYLRESIKIAHRALLNGRHPFGCILVSAHGEILFTQGNIDTLNHAESALCRTAWTNLRSPPPSLLYSCHLSPLIGGV
jgi:hypothetical protein